VFTGINAFIVTVVIVVDIAVVAIGTVTYVTIPAATDVFL